MFDTRQGFIESLGEYLAHFSDATIKFVHPN